MIIGSIKEKDKSEARVSLTPSSVNKLKNEGHTILLEKNYGMRAGFTDEEYLKAGAIISKSTEEICTQGDIISQISPSDISLLSLQNKEQLIIADFKNTSEYPQLPNTTYLHLEKVPRTSVAQSIDIQSTQATIRGYAAAIFSLAHANRIAPQLMTGAATTRASTALIIGASITGLQAAAVLKRQGCLVTIADVNDKAQELANSIGVNFIKTDKTEPIKNILKDKNFIITAASSQTGESPQIIQAEELRDISANTIIFDTTLNNVSITLNSKKTKTYKFYRNTLAERLFPQTSSELWASSILNLLKVIITSDNTYNFSAPYIIPTLTDNHKTT